MTNAPAPVEGVGCVPQLGMSVALGSREPIDRMVAVVQLAERLGVDATWVIDSQLLYRDAYLAMAVLARETDRMTLGPGVTNLITRHETVVANAMATLATFAPGRVVVGVGTGDSSVRPLGQRPLKLAELAAGVARLRSLLAGDTVEAAGAQVGISTRPPEVPPIYVAATQPKMLRTAGAVADGVIILGPADPDTVALQMSHIDAGAIEAGRDPSEVRRDLWVGLAVGAGSDPIDDLRSYASTQARVLADWVDLPPSLVPFRDDLREAAAQYDYSGHLRIKATHAHSVSDDFVRAVAIAGTPADCQERLAQLLELGLDRISVTLLPGGRERRLESLAEVWAATIAT